MDRFPTTNRRSFLASALAAGSYAALAGSPVARAALAAQEEPPRRLPALKVARDRVIRTVVGLRPYRAEGFVLTNERLGEKVVVHNYGHGGGGVSLSWGVAVLAAEQARNLEDKAVAVMGCGVVGLSTARVLQRRGKTVTIYTAGGRLAVKELKTREEVAQLPERVVFNCTGLGARALFGDQGMASMRGQIEVLLPQPELDYCYLANSLYMFPRADGVILGGTFEADTWSMDADAATTTRIIDGNAQIARGFRR